MHLTMFDHTKCIQTAENLQTKRHTLKPYQEPDVNDTLAALILRTVYVNFSNVFLYAVAM